MAETQYISPEKLISGKEVAANVQTDIAEQVKQFQQHYDRAPYLHVILVGDDPASRTYVSKKAEAATAIGICSETETMPVDITQEALLERIDTLNADDTVNGILVQLPLPDTIEENAVIAAIAPSKDVDGFHVVNSGLLATGQQDKALVACTPKGCMELIRTIHGNDLSGLDAVVVGRSNIVGRPVAQLLEQANATVTTVHSRTNDLTEHTCRADILVVAIGHHAMIEADHVKDGATVIDVGINVIDLDNGKKGVRGDVANSAAEKAAHITPVPGGVGPMTVAMLMENTLKAAYLQQGMGDGRKKA